MKKRDFLKKLGLAAISVSVVHLPERVSSEIYTLSFNNENVLPNEMFNVTRLKDRLEFLRKYPLTPDEAFNVSDVINSNKNE